MIIPNITSFIKREVCEGCSKQIYIGKPAIICKNCDIILHKNCALDKNFKTFRENWYCYNCLSNYDIVKYNPFIEILNDIDLDDNSDHNNYQLCHRNISKNF